MKRQHRVRGGAYRFGAVVEKRALRQAGRHGTQGGMMALSIRTATVGSISSDTGTSSSDFVTSDTTLTVSGTVTTSGSGAAATLNIYLVGGAFGTGNGTLVGSTRISAGGRGLTI